MSKNKDWLPRVVSLLPMLELGIRCLDDEAYKVHMDQVKETRDALYRRLCKNIEHDFDVGIPVRKIAKRYGISRQRVHTILSRRKKGPDDE